MGESDINQLDLMNEVVEVDGGANPEDFFNPPLADDGEHTVVFKLGSRGVKADRQKEGKGANAKKTGLAFLNVNLQLKAFSDGAEGQTIAFDNPSTVVFDSSVGRTTRAHMTFAAAGFTLPEHASLGELKTAIEAACAQNPKAVITTQWEAQVKDADGSYRTVLSGQKNFPKTLDASGNETERHSPEVLDSKTGQTARAQVRITKYRAVE